MSSNSFPTIVDRSISLGTSVDINQSSMSANIIKLQNLFKEKLQGEHLNLAETNLTDLDVCALGAILKAGELKGVTHISLANNQIPDHAVAALVEGLESTSGIVSLDLSANSFGPSGIYRLLLLLSTPEATLTKLNLAENVLTKEGIGYIGEILQNNDSLVDLQLTDITIGESISKLVEGLKVNESLKTLNLENTKLIHEDFQVLFDGLCQEESRSRLQDLNIGFNIIPDNKIDCVEPLFSSKNFPHLRVLHLSFVYSDGIKGDFSRMMERKMRGNTTLEELYFDGNGVDDKCCIYLQSIIRGNSTLKVFDLGDNAIQARGAGLILAALRTNKKLVSVRLDGNAFMDDADKDETAKKLKDDINKLLKENEKRQSNRQTTSVPSTVLGSVEFNKETNIARSKLKRASGDAAMANFAKSDDGLSSKPKKKRNFANRINKPIRKRTPQSYNNNMNDDDDTFVEVKEKKLRKFKVKMNNRTTPIKKPRDMTDSNSGRCNDNLQNDFESVVFGDMKPEKPKRLRNFVGKSKVKTKLPVCTNPDWNDNLENDFESCVLNNPPPMQQIQDFSDDDSVIVNDDDDFQSVVYESKEKTEENNASEHHRKSVKKKWSLPSDFSGQKTLARSIAKEDCDSLSRASAEVQTWEAISKELGFLEKLKQTLKSESKDPEGVLLLNADEVKRLGNMLTAFDNLLDRDEHCNSMRMRLKPSGKRKFAEKLGVIGLIRSSPQPINFTLAKSVIDQKLIRANLVNNVCLLSMFKKLRREIGNGVPTRIGGMLPSTLFNSLVSEESPVVPNLQVLENYGHSVLLLKVIIWSIMKALVVSDPSIDPNGRHLLEEFGKALLDGDHRAAASYEQEDPEMTAMRRQMIGSRILSGALYELLDILILLKPMIAFTEALQLIVTTDETSQPPLELYEKKEARHQRKAEKHLSKGMQRVEKKRAVTSLKLKLKEIQSKGKDENNSRSTSPNRLKSSDSDQKKRFWQGFERLQVSLESDKKKGVKKERTKVSEYITISEATLRYRANCPERVQSLLSDLATEFSGLTTILSVEKFLPYLFTFCDSKKIAEHYNNRVQAITEQLPNWIKKLGCEFNSEMMDHLLPEITPEVAGFLNFSGEEVKPTQLGGGKNEFQMVQERLKKKKIAPRVMKSVTKKVGSSLEKESYFHSLLNQIFNQKTMTPTSIVQIQDYFEGKMGAKDQTRDSLIKHMKALCIEGCNETFAAQTMKAYAVSKEMAVDLGPGKA